MALHLHEINTGEVPVETVVAAAIERGIFVFDLETTGLDVLQDRIEGIAIYVPEVNIMDEISVLFPRDKVRRGEAVWAWYPFVEETMMMYVQPDETEESEAARLAWLNDPSNKEKEREFRRLNEPQLRDLRAPMDQRTVMEALRPLFENYPEVVGIAHHTKFDEGFVIHSSGADYPITFNLRLADSMLLDFIGDENDKKYGLKHRVEKLLGHKMVTYEAAARLRRQQVLPFMAEHVQPLGIYAMEDVFQEWRMFDLCYRRLMDEDDTGRLERIYWKIDMKISSILREMECAGVLIDWEWLTEVTRDLQKQKDTILDRIEHRVGGPFNPNSAPKVAAYLFGSPQQGGLGLPIKGVARGKSGQLKTGNKEIGHLRRADPFVADLLDWRSLDTVQSAFSVKIADLARKDPLGRLHGHFNQTGTKIFRLSSSDPVNFQNQPRDRNLIRKAFVGYLDCEMAVVQAIEDFEERQRAHGELIYLFGADYSQIELRVAAHLSGDRGMIEVYQTGKPCTHGVGGDPCDRYKWWECESRDENGKVCGHSWLPAEWPESPAACPKCGGHDVAHQKRCRHVDLHQRTAEDVGVPRNPLAKNLNFGSLYRIGPHRFCQYADLYDERGDARVEYARDVLDGWYKAYPAIPFFHEVTEEMLRKNGWISRTITGRRRRLSGDRWQNEYRAITQGIQFQVSGSAQDILKIAMIRIAEERAKNISSSRPAERRLWEQVRFLIQVHDEIVMEGPYAIREEIIDLIERNMKNAAHLKVPLESDCKFGQSWDHIH